MQTLIVLGASVRAAAFSAIRAGFAPYSIDQFADRDLAGVCPAIKIARYPDEFLEALAAAPEAPWFYTGGLENHPRLVGRLAELRPLLGNPGSVLRAVRDPRRLATIVQGAGLSVPDMSPTPVGASTFEGWLVKPQRSSGGVGIRFARAADFARPPRGALLQRYVGGEAASSVFVASGGRAFYVGATRQLLGRDFLVEQPFLYAGSIGPLAISEPELAALKRLGEMLAGEFGLAGLFNVDFVRTADGLWPLEVNPRYSASVEVLERALGIECVARHVAACGGDVGAAPRTLDETPAVAMCGKAVVYGRKDAVAGTRFEKLVSEWNGLENWPLIADVPHTGETICTGQPVATVFATGNTPQAVMTELRERIAAVHAALGPI